MIVATKKELLEQLKDMKDLVKKCPNDMSFHVNIEFSGLDKDFMRIAKDWNIKQALKVETLLKEHNKPEGNI